MRKTADAPRLIANFRRSLDGLGSPGAAGYLSCFGSTEIVSTLNEELRFKIQSPSATLKIDVRWYFILWYFRKRKGSVALVQTQL